MDLPRKEVQDFLSNPEVLQMIDEGNFLHLYLKAKIEIPYQIGNMTLWLEEVANIHPLLEPSLKVVPPYYLYSSMIENFVIPNHIEVIMTNACLDCYDLKSVTLPRSLKGISKGVFDNCFNLKTINYLGTKEELLKNIKLQEGDWDDLLADCPTIFIQCADGPYQFNNREG